MYLGTCLLRFEEFLDFNISLRVYKDKYEIRHNGNIENLSNFKDVQAILIDKILDKENLLSIRPNKLYVHYLKEDLLLNKTSLDIFNKDFFASSEFSLENFYEAATSYISDLERDLTFYLLYREKTSDGLYGGTCQKCNHSLFYDENYDALLCFHCDEWRESFTKEWKIKPSDRKIKHVPETKYSKTLSPCSINMTVKYPSKGRVDRVIRIEANTDSTFSIKDQKIDDFNELILMISSKLYPKGVSRIKEVSMKCIIQNLDYKKSVYISETDKNRMVLNIGLSLIELLNTAGIWIPFHHDRI